MRACQDGVARRIRGFRLEKAGQEGDDLIAVALDPAEDALLQRLGVRHENPPVSANVIANIQVYVFPLVK